MRWRESPAARLFCFVPRRVDRSCNSPQQPPNTRMHTHTHTHTDRQVCGGRWQYRCGRDRARGLRAAGEADACDAMRSSIHLAGDVQMPRSHPLDCHCTLALASRHSGESLIRPHRQLACGAGAAPSATPSPPPPLLLASLSPLSLPPPPPPPSSPPPPPLLLLVSAGCARLVLPLCR